MSESSLTEQTDLSGQPEGPPSVMARITAAWAAHDATAFADVFTEDGSMTLPGHHVKSRTEIRTYMDQAFQGPYQGTQVTGEPVDVQVLGPDAVIILSKGGIVPAGSDQVAATDLVRACWVVVRRNDEWQLAAYQNTPAGVS